MLQRTRIPLMTISLRPYQVKAIDKIQRGFAKTHKQLCVLPTGSGKTVVFSHVIQDMMAKTLIIAHTKELVAQAMKTVRSICPHLKVGMLNSSTNLDVVVTTIQAVFCGDNLKTIIKENFDLLIIDECHRARSSSYEALIKALSPIKYLGCTATPYRTDKKSVQELFGQCSFSFSLIDMIEEGFLCDLTGYKVKTNISLSGIRKQKGDFQANELTAIVNVKNRNELIVKEYLKLSPHEKTIAFCSSIKHAQDLRNEFISQGISCEDINGKLRNTHRDEVLSRFKQGKTRVLTNCNLLTEGFDEPSITAILMCRPTVSKTLYVQMIGRGTRLFQGKSHCKVIEFTDNDFDVCQMEDLLDTPQKKVTPKQGESLRDYAARVKEELPDGDEKTTVQVHRFVEPRKTYKNKMADEWQKDQLRSRNIKWIEPLLDITANWLLTRGRK